MSEENYYGKTQDEKEAIDIEAEASLKKALAVHPKFALALERFGMTFYRKNQLDSAIVYFDKALKADTSSTEAMNNKAAILFGRGKVAEAETLIEKSLRIDSLSRDGNFNRGNIYGQKGDYPNALKHLKKAIEIDEEHANEKRINALKPMNCPGHVQIYNQGIKSYRDLPLKFAEFGSCHRYEPSGTMHGLMRVRAFTQDDGHIFCTENQIESETGLFIKFLSSVYADLGFKSFDIKLSTRPEMRVGSDEIWDKAELALETAIKNLGYPYKIDEGDGAFYGPKLDFVLTDAIGRDWQCGTFQLDFNLAERLDAEYVGEDGKKHIPVMIHRAILGSFERFIGILIENYAGKLPLWLAPRQVVIASITSDVNSYVNEVASLLKEMNVRVETDTRNEKISYKVREHSASKVPVIMVIGKKEMEERTISIRRLGSSENTSFSLNDIVEQIAQESKDSYSA